MYAYLIHHAPHPVWGLETRGVFGMRRERWVESARLVCAGQVLGRSRRFKVDGRSGILAVDRMPDEECGGSTVGREGKSRYAVKVYVAPCFRRPVLNGAMASGEWHRVDCDFDGLIESWEVVVSDEPVDIAAHMREVGFREVERGSFRLERDFSNEWPKDCGRIQTLDDAPPNGIWHVAATMIRKLLASSQMPTQWRPNPVCSPYCCDEIFDIVQHGSAGGTRHRLATVRGAADSQREIDSAGADAVAAAHGLRHVSGV